MYEYMKQVPQFVLHRDKIPVNVKGEKINHLDPKEWMSLDHANTMATALNCGKSFVLTEQDGLWCIDGDKCRNPETGELTGVINQIIASLPGAAIETSQSGTGVHIWGIGNPSDAFMNKCSELGIEFYRKERHICIGTHQSGEILDWGDYIQQVQAQFWKPRTEVGEGVWTTAPVEGYNGPTDNQELLKRMLESKPGNSAENMFMTDGPQKVKASFADLWYRNVPILSQAYPDSDETKDFGYSEADFALAGHLLWWTGGNCERTERLMRMSGLKRDKWDTNKGYLKKRTISRSAAGRTEYYMGMPEMVVASTLTEVGKDLAANKDFFSPEEWAQKYPYGSILTPTEQTEVFHGCVYVKSQRKVFTPYNRMFRSPEEFKDDYSHWDFVHSPMGKSTDDPWKAFVKSKTVIFPAADVTCFRPEDFGKVDDDGNLIVVFEEEGRKMFSTYVPIESLAKEGDVSPFLNHMKKLLPDETDRKILISYMASAVQNPGNKFQWAPIIQGAEGNGKTFLLTALSRIIGYTYSHIVNASELGTGGAKFNSWIQNKLLVGVEELHTKDKRDVVEALKPLITNERIEIQAKGADQYTGDNRANFLICTNHKDAIQKTNNNRRYAIFYTAQQSVEDCVRDGMTNAYFKKLYDWLKLEGGDAIIGGYLKGYVIDENFDPAKLCQRAPDTSSTNEAITLTRGPIEASIIEAIDSEQYGFCGGFISSIMLDKLLTDAGRANFLSLNKRGDMLKELGFIKHPVLTKGRATQVVAKEGGRPVLFVDQTHPAALLGTPKEVMRAYNNAQPGIGS